jgi:acyl transferase domain-containing protein
MDPLAERLKKMTPLQRAVFALRETQARLDALEQKRTEPIAIVGMACRFPGAVGDPASYWRLLCDGVDAIGEIPPDRWNVDDFYDPDPAAPGKMATRWGGFLDRIDEFDNHFFGISDREATRIDPQQRMLLELAWEALEDAGLPPCTLRGGKIGVFVGISVSEYGMILSGDLAQTDAHVAAGTSLCLAANRVSFALGLQGPSMALDTACSSSLVAVHLACQGIRNGECDAALVGGANLLLSPTGAINLTKAGFCASDGRVRAFDAAASGYVRSEGVGVVVLKPLAAALKNNDPVYAVIRGSAVNQNGSSNGVTAPSRAAQEQVLREAYARARVAPAEVQFVETQGTGTRLGDTIEATALGNVLGEDRPPDSRCTIGALKTNIGHLEAASGIASLMKAALALRHRQLPPNLHFQTPNPDIPFDTLPLRVPRTLEPWPECPHPRLAGVSAFGFGGSNAHVVLEEFAADTSGPHPKPLPTGQRTLCLLPLSARTENALHDLARRYSEFLRDDPPSWSDVCYTAAARRQHHDCRLAVLAESHRQAVDLLAEFLTGQPRPNVFVGRKPYGRGLKIAFFYDDRVENWKPYLRQLAQTACGFVEVLSELDAVLNPIVGWSLTAALEDDARWSDPAYARPTLLALQLALTAWWRRLAVTPDVVLGKGVGELAAASAAGILTPAEALRLAAANGPTDAAPPSRPALLPFLSAVDGAAHVGPDLDIVHWRSALEHSQGFATAIGVLAQRHVDVCLEIGPESISGHLAQEQHSIRVAPSLLRSPADGVDLLTTVGALYAAGADILWQGLTPADARCVRVPTYPWQRQPLWAPRRNRPAAAPVDQSPPGETAAEPSAVEEVRQRSDLTTPYVAPRTALETTLAESWSAVLRIDRVGIHDNFLELGGDSLQATILLNRLQEQLGEAVPGHMLFHAQTIDDLADYLRQNFAAAVRRRHPEEQVGDGEPSAAAVPSIPRLARAEQTEQLLARLDELTDEEVESLLSQSAAESEVSHD